MSLLYAFHGVDGEICELCVEKYQIDKFCRYDSCVLYGIETDADRYTGQALITDEDKRKVDIAFTKAANFVFGDRPEFCIVGENEDEEPSLEGKLFHLDEQCIKRYLTTVEAQFCDGIPLEDSDDDMPPLISDHQMIGPLPPPYSGDFNPYKSDNVHNEPLIDVIENFYGNIQMAGTKIVIKEIENGRIIALGHQCPDGTIDDLTDEEVEICKMHDLEIIY